MVLFVTKTWGKRGVSWLQNHPILLKNKHFHIVNFGIFSALNAITILFILFYYLYLKGIPLTESMAWMLPLCAVFVWLGARMMHLLSIGKVFFKEPKKYLFQTGFYMQGGVVGAFLWSIIFSHVYEIPISLIWDGLCLGTLLGQFFGRIGCFNYGCCYGRPTNRKIGTSYQHPGAKILRLHPELKGVPVHPAQLYKATANLIMFIIMIILVKQSIPNGVLVVTYLFYHGISRMAFEAFRYDLVHEKKRIWISFKFAWLSITLAIILLFWGSQLDATFFMISPFLYSFSLSTFILFHQTFSGISIMIFIVAFFIFLGYGIHGTKLGTFPFTERSHHENKSHDHRSRTLWDKSSL
jgi:prolipoprotein diacylglyceryltransferase